MREFRYGARFHRVSYSSSNFSMAAVNSAIIVGLVPTAAVFLNMAKDYIKLSYCSSICYCSEQLIRKLTSNV